MKSNSVKYKSKQLNALISLLLALVMVLSLLPVTALAEGETSITAYVTMSRNSAFVTDKDGAKVVHRAVELTGKSAYTIDDALRALHEAAYTGGAEAGYVSAESVYGTALSKLWGNDSGNFGYYVNNAMAMNLDEAVTDGSYIDAFIYQYGYPNTETYAHFNMPTVTAGTGESVELTLNYIFGLGDAPDYAPIFSVLPGASITVNGTAPSTPVSTSADGKATLSFDTAGTYIISATGPEGTNITAPACVVTVTAASTEPVFEIQVGSDEAYASIPGGTLSYNMGDTPLRLKVVQTAGETVTPTYRWKKATSADGALGSAGRDSQTNKVNYLLSTTAMGETWYACEVTYTPEGGEETMVTVGRVKVSVDLTQAALEANAGFSTQPAGGSWGFGDSGDGLNDYGAILQAMPNTNLWGEGSSMMWKVSNDGGENWTETSDYGTDPTEVFEMGEYSLALYTLPAGNYKFKAVATFKTSDLAGNPLTATVDSNIVDVTIIDTSIDMDGEGTEASPYLIKTSADLQKVSEMTAVTDFKGVYFKFANDITLPAGWTPIGTDKNRFSGNIDGDGRLLTIPENEKPLIGCPKEATLKNLNIYGAKINGNGVVAIYTIGVKGFTAITIENVTLKSGTQTLGAGFVSGYAPGDYPVVIRNCTVEAGVIIGYDGTKSNIGSFGGDFNGTIIGCVSHATVKGVSYVGGISGSKGQTMGDYIIADCIFDGEVIASGDNVGGVSGGGYAGTSLGISSAPNTPCATIINCLVSGSITGANNVGGILGSEPGVKECWNNGIGYIQNNLFTGTLTATDTDANVGGIIGYMSCINNMNVISGNFYKEGCGATAGIGAAGMVETTETSGSFGTGWYKYTLSGKKWGRDDDPMGAGAGALTKSCTAAELTDGTVLAALNSGYNSSKNWGAGTDFPTFTAYGEKHIYRIVCTTLNTMNGVTQEANGADVTAGKTLTLLYTDGSKTTLSAEDNAVKKGYTVTTGMIGTYVPASLLYDGHQLVFNLGITNTLPIRKPGVDATTTDTATAGKAWTLDLSTIFIDPDGDALTYKVKIDTASYVEASTVNGVYSYTPTETGSVTLTFKAHDGTKDSTQTYKVTLGVNAAPVPVPSDDITVTFTLLGDSAHGEDGGTHTLKEGNLETWIAKSRFTVSEGDTVKDVLNAALAANGMICSNPTGNYVESITKDGVTLAEFTNGKNSGWMYTLNGTHPLFGVSEQTVSNGDVIVFHYTDDYTKEQGSEEWGPTVPTDPDKPETELPFTDVAGHWALEAITYAYDNGLMEGDGEKFSPDDTLTRAMLVTILYRLEGEPKISAENPFADVTPNEWYTDAIIWAAENKIVEGYSVGSFGPTDDITREQLVTMLYNYSLYKKHDVSTADDLSAFNDAGDVSDWALDAVKQAVAAGLIEGRTDDTIVPGGDATRAETATILMRYTKSADK